MVPVGEDRAFGPAGVAGPDPVDDRHVLRGGLRDALEEVRRIAPGMAGDLGLGDSEGAAFVAAAAGP